MSVKASNEPVQYTLSGTETDTLEGDDTPRERMVTGSGRIDYRAPGRRYEFQPRRKFAIDPGEIPPTQIEEMIVPSQQ